MSDVFDGIPRGVPRREGRPLGLEDQAMPAASFLDPAAIEASRTLQWTPDKVFLGVSSGIVERRKTEDGRAQRHILGGIPIGTGDDRHLVTIAGSRAGKGRSVIVPTLLTYEGSCLATDPKGELATITARAREEKLGHRVIVLDPFEVARGYAADRRGAFNPMAMLRYDADAEHHPDKTSPSLIEDAGLIADALVVPSGGDAHWDESARNFIEGVILHVATHKAYAGSRHLMSVRNLIAGRGYFEHPDTGERVEGMDALLAEMEFNRALSGLIRDAAYDFSEKPERERGSVLSTARRHIRFLSYGRIGETVSGHDFELADLKRGQLTVYLCLPATRMGTCNRWLRMFVNLALAALEREPGQPRHPVLLCLDEFAVLGHMKSVEDAAGQIAGFGVRLWPIVQDLGQLKSLYKDRWESFLGNAGVLQFFGNNDLMTLEWVSKRLGTTSLIVRNQGEVGDREATETGKRGASWSVQTQSLMTVEEIAQIFGRDDPLQRQLILWAGLPPIILQRVKYDSHSLFAGLFDER